MKIIITEEQYYNLLEIKSNKTIRITESQYRRLLEVKHSTLLNEYENIDLGDGYQNLVPEFGNLLTHLSTLSLQNNTVTSVEVKSGKEIVVDTNNEELLKSLKEYIEGSRIDWETSEDNGKLTIKYTKKILPVVSSDDDGGVESEIDDATYDVDNIITLIRNKTNLQKNNVQKPETLDTLVRDEIKNENPTFYEKVKKDGKFIRYCFPHMHWGTDIGGDADKGNIIYFKEPFKVTKKGNECFIIDSLDGKYHKFCHSNKVFVEEDEDKGDLIPNPLGVKKYYKIGDVGTKGHVTAAHIHYEIGTGVDGSKLTGQYNPSGEWEKYWGVIKRGDLPYNNETIDSSKFITNKYDIKDSKNYGWRRFSKDGKLCKQYKEKYK